MAMTEERFREVIGVCTEYRTFYVLFALRNHIHGKNYLNSVEKVVHTFEVLGIQFEPARGEISEEALKWL